MASNFDDFITRVRDATDVAADITQQAFKNTKKTIDKTVELSTLNTRIRRISLSIKNEYMAIGELVYATHKDPETSGEGLQSKLARIDELHVELDEAKAERDRRQAE